MAAAAAPVLREVLERTVRAAPAIQHARRRGSVTAGARIAPLGAFLLATFTVLLAANVIVAGSNLPDYRTWTGIRAFEAKLRQLDDLARHGPVDAVILGSSPADTGFSTETYSQLMSRGLGRSYRAYNLATGGAEVASLPKLYRLMRTVPLPRTVLLVLPAGIKREDQVVEHMPDYFLERAPVRGSLNNQLLLDAHYSLWRLGLMRYGSAVRDLFLYGRFANLPSQGVDLNAVSPSGDRIAYSRETTDVELAQYRHIFETQLPPLAMDVAQTRQADRLALLLQRHGRSSSR